MKSIVFVHGAFGGGYDYKPLQKMLEAEGCEVYRVTLSGLGEREHLGGPDINLDTHILDVVNVLKFEELANIILVGHSYGGMVITGVAHRTPERIAHLVYMDAMLPEDGESAMDDFFSGKMAEIIKNHIKDDWKIVPWWPGWGKDVPHPLGTWTQPIKLGNPAVDKIPGTYVRAVNENSPADRVNKSAERAKARGYDYHEWNIDHNMQRSMREEYVNLLLSIK